MNRIITLNMPDAEAKTLYGHGFYAKFVVSDKCAHENTGPCEQEHWCAHSLGFITCHVFESEHRQFPSHQFEPEECGTTTCLDCKENLK